ncbi:MAG: capsule assembly Wzi family protein [Rhodothermales bacterium]
MHFIRTLLLSPRFLSAFFLAVVFAAPTQAQKDGLLQPGDDIHRFLERMQTAGLLNGAHLSHRPLSAYEARGYLDQVSDADSGNALSSVDRTLLARYRDLDPTWRNDLFGAESSDTLGGRTDWAVQINPLLNMSAGRAFLVSEEDPALPITGNSFRNVWQNSRGARLSGHIGPYLFFEGRLTENQRQPLINRLRDSSAPGLPSVQFKNGDTYDWMDSQGMIGLRTNHFEVRFGRDRNLWGTGTSSTMLSDFPTAYDQVQIRTSVWRLQYTNLFAALAVTGAGTPTGFRPRKYSAMHRLAIRITDRIEVGLFETVVFATDSLGTRDRFDLAYANPIILYRAAERDRGSPDNVLIGLSGSWRPVDNVRLYGEFMLDEFASSFFGEEWWANKWAWMTGVHVTNLPLERLDLRAEVARIRPFMYAHKGDYNAFTHFGDGLGHPAGANAIEFDLRAHYTATARLALSGSARLHRQGMDLPGENMGADPTRSYQTRLRDFGHTFLQGDLAETMDLQGSAHWNVWSDLVLDAGVRVYRTSRESTGSATWLLPEVAVRWGIPLNHRIH